MAGSDVRSFEERCKSLLRDLPESFWDVSAWDGEDLVAGTPNVDRADRFRITQAVIRAYFRTRDQ